jgi:hypothetical protein
MPVILALLLRQVIMSVATGAVVTGAQELLNGTAKELVNEIKDTEKITERDALDVVGNIFADLALNSTAIFTTLKFGVGVKAAEYLGLTARGLAKKTLTGAAATTATKLAANGGKVVATSLFKKVATIAAVPASGIWLVSALANIIEPGIYKPEQTNALYKQLGIPWQYPVTGGALKPGPFSTESFRDYANALEAAEVTQITKPIPYLPVAFSKENLADLVDYIYGKEVMKGNAPSANKLIPLLAPFLVGGNSKSVSITSTPSPSTNVNVAPITKVFTGIVSQGVVSAGLSFTPRPDDLIESVEELRTAASNNLAPFLAALLGKVVYEVKVVSSVISKDGFKQTGTTQKIQTGTFTNGQPKYKTVTNKFATLVVYALTDKGSRAKLTTIVLGPTNSAKLTVAQNDLQALQNELPKLVTTNDVNEITNIINTTDAFNTTTGAPNPDYIAPTAPVVAQGTPSGLTAGQLAYYRSHLSEGSIASVAGRIFFVKSGRYESQNGTEILNLNTGMIESITSTPVTVPVVTSAAPSANKAGANASTLYEWYQAQGQAMPSVSARALIYAGFGLGQSSYYTGTSEQNTKLLAALKTS